MKMSKYIIDVSEHNGSINLSQVKSSIDGIIARCSWGWGTNQVDREWNSNAQQADNIGLPLFAYHFCYARNENEALSEAKLALSTCKKYNVNVIYYNMEYSDFQGNLTSELYYKIAKTFADHIESNGYAVGIYANEDWFRNRLTNEGFSKWTLWIANYGLNNGYDNWNGKIIYNPFGHVLLHQFTSNAKVGVLKNIKGIISARLDCSIDFGLLEKFSKPKSIILISLNIGDKVKVRKNSTWYDGQAIPEFVYNNIYSIIEIINNRVVIGVNGIVTGAIHKQYLYK